MKPLLLFSPKVCSVVQTAGNGKVKLQSVASQMGERGLANKAFPISRAVLLGSSILSSNAFIANSEKASVPSWRNAADFPLKFLWSQMNPLKNVTSSSLGSIC